MVWLIWKDRDRSLCCTICTFSRMLGWFNSQQATWSHFWYEIYIKIKYLDDIPENFFHFSKKRFGISNLFNFYDCWFSLKDILKETTKIISFSQNIRWPSKNKFPNTITGMGRQMHWIEPDLVKGHIIG